MWAARTVACLVLGSVLKLLLGHGEHSEEYESLVKPGTHMQSLHDAPGRLVVLCVRYCTGFSSTPRQIEPIVHAAQVGPLTRFTGNLQSAVTGRSEELYAAPVVCSATTLHPARRASVVAEGGLKKEWVKLRL